MLQGGKPVTTGRKKSNRTPVWILLLLLIFIIGLAALAGWLLFLKKATVTAEAMFQIEPQPECLFIDNERLPLSKDTPIMLAVGEHLLEAAVPGYAVLEEIITVAPNKVNDLSFQLNPLPGVLSIRTNTPTTFFINEMETALGPAASTELEPGKYTIRADGGPDFLPASTEVELTGKRKRHFVELELIRSWAWITVESDPPHARVIDPATDELVGLAGKPIKVMAKQEPYNWVLSGGPRYQPIPLEFTVVPDKDLDLGEYTVELRYARATVTSTPTGVPIALNGKLTKFTTPHRFHLPANRIFEISLQSQLHEPWSESIRTEPNRDYKFHPQLNTLKGKLVIHTTPRRVEVYYNNKLLGLTPLEVETQAGRQVFQFKRLGFLEKEGEAQVRPGSTTELNLTMERE